MEYTIIIPPSLLLYVEVVKNQYFLDKALYTGTKLKLDYALLIRYNTTILSKGGNLYAIPISGAARKSGPDNSRAC